jgi:uncharacterized protein (DUF58 family)
MLSAAEAGQLDRFALAAHGAAASAAGRRPVDARGYSVEFHDFRHYQPGDDPRAIDWTIDARLRQLVVRLYRAEGHVPLHLLVDTSASMGIGAPAKLTTATRVAAALGYVAAKQKDPMALATFASSIEMRAPLAAGRPQLLRVLETLAALQPRGRSAFDRALTDYATIARGPGLGVVISDFLSPSATFDGLRLLAHRGLSLVAVHVLADEELQPDLDGDVELVDAEGTAPPLVVGPADVEAYLARLERSSRDLRTFCAQHRAGYVLVRASSGFEHLVAGCVTGGIITLRA